MRRMLVGLLLCIGIVFGVAGVAAAEGEDASCYPCDVGGVSISRPAGDPAGSRAQLPFTGSDGTSTLVWLGGGLAVAGGVIVVVSRRRSVSIQA